jgi:AraC family transcriptional activator of pobA
MEKKQPQEITFSDMEEIVIRLKDNGSRMSYIGSEFGVVIGGNIFKVPIPMGVPLIIEDSRVLLLREGSADVTMNLTDIHLTSGSIVYIGRGSIAQINQASDNMRIEGLFFRDDFLNLSLHGKMPTSLNGQARHFHIQPTNDEFEAQSSILHSIWRITNNKDFSVDAVRSMVASAMYNLDFLRQKSSDKEEKSSTHEKEVFNKFIMLVNSCGGSERSLSYYADRICLSPRYLGTIIKMVSGHTAKYWIDRSAIFSAEVMLKHSDHQIAEISDSLNFPNVSFFCKYFKRLTGKTPKEYSGK